MGVLAFEVSVIWSIVALVTGVALGTLIRKADRKREDEYLAALLSTISTMQTTR